jgi:hypothetical protein
MGYRVLSHPAARRRDRRRVEPGSLNPHHGCLLERTIMTMIAVGQLYQAGRTSWPEGIDFNLLASGPELRLFMRSPTAAEVADVRKGEAWGAIYREASVAITAWRFGAFRWMDVSFDHTRTPSDIRMTDFPSDEFYLVTTVLLVDAATGILHAIRTVTMSPAMSCAVIEVAREQLASGRGINPAELERVMQQPTDTLVKRAQRVERLGVTIPAGSGGPHRA